MASRKSRLSPGMPSESSAIEKELFMGKEPSQVSNPINQTIIHKSLQLIQLLSFNYGRRAQKKSQIVCDETEESSLSKE